MAVHKTAASSRISDILDHLPRRGQAEGAQTLDGELADVADGAAAGRAPAQPKTFPEKQTDD